MDYRFTIHIKQVRQLGGFDNLVDILAHINENDYPRNTNVVIAENGIPVLVCHVMQEGRFWNTI